MRLSGTKLAATSAYRGLGAQLYDLAGMRPSLDLRFADNKSLVDATTGQSLVTFTRASSGTYVGSDGLIKTATTNEPRFDHNPTTGESLGLLVEEQRVNLALQSENFGTTWTLNGLLAFGSGSTLNAATAPDGASTADLITEDTATSTHVTTQGSLSFTSGTTYTVSCFVKRGTGSRNAAIALRTAAFSGAPRVNIDLSTGATTLTGSGGTTGSQAYPNGWWRVFLTATATATVTSFVDIGLVSGASTLSYAGDGTSGVYLWGAQLEAGAFPTSYIPTTTATVTRSADVASITGTAFSSWYRQDAGAFYAEAIGVNNFGGATRRYYEVSDGTANNRLLGGYSTTSNNRALVSAGGVTQADIFVAASPALSTKHCFSYSSTSAQLAVGGVLGTEDNSTTLFTGSVMYIGSDTVFTTGAPLNGHIRRLTYWPTRLSNSTLQAVTQ